MGLSLSLSPNLPGWMTGENRTLQGHKGWPSFRESAILSRTLFVHTPKFRRFGFKHIRKGTPMNHKLPLRGAVCLLAALCTITTLTWAGAPNTIFQLDGNPAADGTTCNYGSGSVQCDTWNLLNLTGSSGTGRGHSALNTFILGTSNTNSFQGGGSKDPLDLSKWAYSTTPTPNKDTLNAGYAAAYNIGSQFDVIFGADRLSPNGDANIGIWFFQQNVGLANGKFINNGTGLPAHHVDGDVLILSSFTNGGGNSIISVYKWDSSCTSASKTVAVGECFAANLRTLATASSV